MQISAEKREQLRTLIAEGKDLDPDDLKAFYRWVFSSYEALDFCPFQQRRFDEYCRSSRDPNFVRVYVGIWLLKLTLDEISSDHTDSQRH